MAGRKPNDVLKDSITALEAVSADMEVQQSVADEANKQIKVLRTQVQANAFDNISSRSEGLKALILVLECVANKAGHKDSCESVAKVRGLLAEAKTFVDAFQGK